MKRAFPSLVAMLLGVACYAQQSKPTPHTVIENGLIFDVAYDVRGLQPEVADSQRREKITKLQPSQNSQSLRYISDFVNGLSPEPRKWSIHRIQPNSGGIGGGQVSLAVHGVESVRFPAFDAGAGEAAFFDITYRVSDVSFDGFPNSTPEEKEAARKQKPFLPANFTIKIKNLPAGRVSKVGGYSIKSIGDLDGDGRLDFAVVGDIALTLPIEDVDYYIDWVNSWDPASDNSRPLEIVYLDGDLLRVFSVSFNAEIVSLGYADLFLGPESTAGREVQVTLRAKGIVIGTNPPENKGS